MNTRLSTKGWDYDPYVHYRNPVRHECGCGRPARYYVYENRQPHCEDCFRSAIDCTEMVPVKVI